MARRTGGLWFAWFPVHTNRGWRWLSWVFRDVIEYESGDRSVHYYAE